MRQGQGCWEFRTNCRQRKHLTRPKCVYVSWIKRRTSRATTAVQVRLVNQVSATTKGQGQRVEHRLVCDNRPWRTNVVDTARRQIVLDTKRKAKLNNIRGNTKLENCYKHTQTAVESLHFKFLDFFWFLGVLRGEKERLRERRDRFDESSSLFDLDLESNNHPLD